MLAKPGYHLPYRIVGIDPGTNNLGLSILDVDLHTHQISLTGVMTIKAGRSLSQYGTLTETHGERDAKLQIYTDELYQWFYRLRPTCIISESPFMGRFPQAYAALVECLFCIRRAVSFYLPYLPLELATPTEVKLAVGAPTKGGGKEAVKQALLQVSDIENPFDIDLAQLDEHSVDSIAVAYHKARMVVDNIDHL